MTDVSGVPFSLICTEEALPTKNLDAKGSPQEWVEASRPNNRSPQLTFQHRLLCYQLDTAKLAEDLTFPNIPHWTFCQHLSIILDGLITNYESGIDVSTSIPERLHDRLTPPTSPQKHQHYTTFTMGWAGAPGIFNAEYSLDREDNARYFFICYRLINQLRRKFPTVIHNYAWIPGAITRDDKNVVAWSLTDASPGFILRERVDGIPLREFALDRKNSLAVVANLFFQLVYTMDNNQTQVKGLTLDRDTIFVRKVTVPMDTPYGLLKAPYLVTITSFRQVAVRMNKIDIGYLKWEKFDLLHEAHHLIRTCAPEELQELLSAKSIDELLDRLAGYSPEFFDGIVAEPTSESLPDLCAFYQRYYLSQPVTEIGYLDMYGLLKGTSDTEYLDWVNSLWLGDAIIDQGIEIITYNVEVCERFLDRPIITTAVFKNSIYNFIADLGEFSASAFVIITLINGLMNAVYINEGASRLLFPEDLLRRVQAILRYHDQELISINNLLLIKSPRSRTSSSTPRDTTPNPTLRAKEVRIVETDSQVSRSNATPKKLSRGRRERKRGGKN